MLLDAVIIVVMALLVLLQGGFSAISTCFIGICCGVVGAVLWLRSSRRAEQASIVPLLYAGLAVVYGISACVTGVSLTTLASAGTWAACAGMCFVATAQTTDQRNATIHALGWLGIVTAVAGELVAAGIVPLAGGMVQSRLQFTFQYANAAAAWYGAMTLLCLLSPNVRQRSLAALPLAALLQTQSGGGLLVFAGVSAVLVVRAIRATRWQHVFDALLQVALAVLLFVCTTFIGGIGACAALALIVFVCFRLPDYDEKIVQRVEPRRGTLLLVAVLGVCLLVGAFVFSGRMTSAFDSWVERTCQMRDGLRLWASSPLVGIGPNNWQYLYQYVQTAPYYTTVVHSSVVQFLVDAGILGLVCFGAACFVGIKTLGCSCIRKDKGAAHKTSSEEGPSRKALTDETPADKTPTDETPTDKTPTDKTPTDKTSPNTSLSWTQAEFFTTIFLVAHSFIEFDMQFFALTFLLAFLLAQPIDGPAKCFVLSKTFARVLRPILCILAAMACAVGLLCASTSTAIATASAAEDYAMCANLYEKNPLAKRDVAAQHEYVQSLYEQRLYQKVIDEYAQLSAPSDRAVYYAVLSYYALNRDAEATTTLIERLEAQPYNIDFCTSAQQLTAVYGSDPSLTARLNAAMDAVSRNAEQF